MENRKSVRIALGILNLVMLCPGCSKPSGVPADRASTEKTPTEGNASTITTMSPQSNLEANARVPVADAKMKAELLKARQLLEAGSPEFQQKLVSVMSHFPTVPVLTDEKTGNWTKVRLNTAGVSFDAIRFSSPVDIPADLVWCFVVSESQFGSWNITPSRGTMWTFEQFKSRHHLVLEDVDLPKGSFLVLQKLERGQILPRLEYFLRFMFRTDEPVDMYVKLKLIPTGSREIGNSSGDLARELGIPHPFKFDAIATLKERVDDLWGNGLFVEALSAIELDMQSPPVARSTLWLHAAVTHDRALQLGQRGQRDAATPLFLKAAAEMRKHKSDFGELESHQQDFFAMALYNEACSLAITGQTEQAVTSFREAVQNGFQELEFALEDEELATLRELPDFRKIIDETKSPAAKNPEL